MADAAPIVTSFISGELSPRVAGRIDLVWHRNGCRIQENMISLPQGPAKRRPGTRFIFEVKDSSKLTALIDFEFSVLQPYVIEAGDGYFRFYRNRGRILDDSAIVNGTFDADITGWTDTSSGTGAIAHDAGTERMSLAGGGAGNEARATQEIASLGISTYTATLDVFGGAVTWKAGTTSGGSEIATGIVAAGLAQGFGFTPGTAGAVFLTFETDTSPRQLDNIVLDNPVYEIDSPYQEADLAGLRWVQSNDVLYVEHGNLAPRKLSRTDHAAWTLEQVDFIDGPYLDENTETANTLTLTGAGPWAVGDTTTMTAAGFNPFLAGHAGSIWRLRKNADTAWVLVTAFTDDQNVTVEFKAAVPAGLQNAATSTWQEGFWSSVNGYPAAWPTFHQERLLHGGVAALPDRLDGSRTGDFENMTPGTNADEALARRLASNQVNAIQWLISKTMLFVGTLAREFRVVGDELNAALTPAAVDAKAIGTDGSSALRPLEVTNVALFVQRHGRQVYEVHFDTADDDFAADDLLDRAEHLTTKAKPIVDWAYQKVPWSVIWAARADGMLLGLTRLRRQDVRAWHRHPLAPTKAGASQVERVVTIPGAGTDELWMVVKRTINGQTRRYIELLGDDFDDDADQADAFFVDSGLSYDGPPIDAITGADHLEGETVQVLADGAVHPDQVVVGGQVTLRKAAKKVHLGLGSTAKLLPVRFEAGALQGTAQGRLKRVVEVAVRLDRSLGFKYGRDEASLEAQPFRKSGDPMDRPPPLFSGDKLVDFPGDEDTDGDVLIVQDQPLPLTVVALMPRLEVAEFP